MRPQATLCALWASRIPLCLGIDIYPTYQSGLALAGILFSNSKDIFSSSSGYTGDPSAIRSFTNGPFGMGSGVIISTGSLSSQTLTPGAMCPSSYTTDLYDAYTQSYCGPDSYNGANYLLNILPIKATTFVIDMVIASCDVVSADKVLVLVNGVNVAKDETGTALDSSSKYLSEPWGIPSPNGDTAFAWTSPPLRFSITLPKFTYFELKMAVCDMHDGYGDTALLIKIRPCNDCDVSFKVDYDTTSVVSTTTYETTSVVTQAASGTVRGTISYITYVTASATSTTAAASEASTTTEFSATSTAAATSSAPTTTSDPSVPQSCSEISNPYQGPSDSQFEVTCNSYSTGGNQIGDTHLVTGIVPCIELCATSSSCKAAMFDRSQSSCYLLDGSDGPAANNRYDMATLLSSETSTTSSPTTTTSAASGPTACNQLDNPAYIDGVQFSIFCGKQATGGNAVDYSAQLHSLTECMTFCVDNLACRAVTFDTSFNECYLYDGFNGFMSDLNKDMGIVASRPAAASTTEAPTEESTTTTALATSTEASTSMASETSASIESTSESPVSTMYTTSSAPVSSGSEETMSLSTSALTSETSSAGTSESQSLKATSAVTSEAVTSLPTTSSPSTSFSSSQDASSGTTSDSALQSTTESESASTASATTSVAAISSSTELSASGSTDATSLSTESVSESTSDAQLVSTSAEESASLEPTTTATTEASLHTDPASIVMSTTETLSTQTPLEETSTAETSISETSSITNSVTAIQSTATGSSLSDTSRVPTETESTSEGSALPSTSSAPSASNIPALGEYTFAGCLKSLDGYPSFKEVATDSEMTTRKCVDLASGSEYIGVYQETCYKADVLDETEFIADARCDLPCPGDHALFCGGILRSGRKLHRRAIAPNHLLTLYRKKLSSSSDVSSASSSVPPSSSFSQATGTHAYETTSETSGISHSSQTGSSYSLSSFTTRGLGSRTTSVSESTTTEAASETRLPTSLPTPTAIHTAYSTLTVNHAYTKTQFAETVTTVTYTTVNPSNPASLITTCVPITLLYSPCGCKDQVYPTVDMTTVACTHGGGVVTLTVPKAAYETGSASYTHPIVQYPTGWVGGHQTDAGGSSHPAAKPTGGSQPGSKNGQPDVPTTATGIQGSYPSYKTHQAVNPTSAAGSYGGDQPEYGKPQPSIPAQGSAESNNNSPENPSQPESPTSLTTEASIVPTSQHDSSALPSQSSPLDQGQVPSESNGAPYATSVVVSEAHKSDLAAWVTMTAIVGMVLFL
ncbi:hypothetical protein FPANT_7902 [Fusarium pseudoanthophilum]|uniref:Apple domain-containing protein n=1 Tax=Fusarium pseudoanthophilum TaxID=48495 RepID=A0A8H5L3X9_9HYPO|nr:hypothetical protein FPANT_7902 [Fusarium pseudoanthophilum]